MHELGRDALTWDAGYLVGYRHATEGRPNLLAEKYAEGAQVIDLRQWRLEHGRCACEERRKADGAGE